MKTRLNVGILGCGHVSEQYLDGCSRFEALEVVACADLDLDRARGWAGAHGIPRAYAPESLLGDPNVQLVINLTPPLAHAEVSLAAVRAGKHVWSEKPLAATLEEARDLVDAAEAAGVRLGCAPDTFLGGGLQTAIKLVDDGWIGEPVAAVAFVSEPGYEHFHPNVDFFYGPGGGPALDLGPYYVTALVAALGPVARVGGLARAAYPRRTIPVGARRGEAITVEVPTHVTGVLEFESGASATLLTSWDIWATHLPYLELYGTEGSLALPNPDEFGGEPRLRRATKEELSQPPPPPGTVEWSPVPLAFSDDVGRGIGAADIAHALATDRPHRASADLALHVLEVLTALERSSSDGRHVEIETRCGRPAPLHPNSLRSGPEAALAS